MLAKRKMTSSTLRLIRSCRVSRMFTNMESFLNEIKWILPEGGKIAEASSLLRGDSQWELTALSCHRYVMKCAGAQFGV